MRTKYILLKGLIIILSLLITSCEDKLDIDQHGAATFETFYKTDEEADEAITTVYSSFAGIQYNYYFVKNLLSDDYWSGGGGRGDNNENEQINEFTFGPEHSYIQGLFQNYYSIIYLSNVVLNHVPDESDIQKRNRAEAKVFRAFAYIDLISMWGTPPFVDHELSPTEYKQPNGDPATLWNLVETDLTEAIASASLTEKSDAYDNSNYRVTKQFAQALLGKAYVFQEKWDKAATVLDEVISSGKYELYDDYENLLTIYGKNNSESLFEINRLNDPDNASTNWSIFYAMIGWRGSAMIINSDVYDETWGFCNPQSELYEAFVENDGVNGYRLTATMKSYELVKAQGDQVIDGKELYGHEGIFMWKTRVLKDEMISGGWLSSYNNFRFMRYAEVLLLAAEAHFRNNNASKAAEYVNKIRQRAHLTDKTAVTMDDIMLEKRLELCGESVRYQDMIRWKIADKMKDQGRKTPWFTSGGTIRWEVYNTGDNAGFKDKHWLLPFPETETTLNDNIIQNPGW
jgi:starch-binding outer membrane protein, SusD/RagB family